MKWDNTSGLSPEVEKQLNDQIQKWLDEDPNPEEGVNSQDTRKLIVDLYAIYKGANSPLEKARLQSEIIQKGAQWDTDNPSLAQIQKYVNRLMKGHYKSADEYLLNADQHTNALIDEGTTKTIRSNGLAGANIRHAKSKKVIEEARQYYLANKAAYPTKKAAARSLNEKYPEVKFGTFVNKLKTW